MEQIHQGHLGTSKCQYRARQCVYWPGINKDIKQLVEACTTCQRHRPQEPRQPLKPTPPPERPWQQLGADFMTYDGSEYLVIVNYYSKMPIVWKMPTSQCNSAKTITVLKELFAEHGIPEEIRSDNGPQFASHLFAEFTKDWNIKHSTSSPRNPRSNGQAESAVKIVKGLLTRESCKLNREKNGSIGCRELCPCSHYFGTNIRLCRFYSAILLKKKKERGKVWSKIKVSM